MPPVRVLLVDDSLEFLQAATFYLSALAQVQLVGSVTSGEHAIEQIQHLRPDLVLLDLEMPGLDGIRATQQIKGQPDAPRVIILTLHDHVLYRDLAQTAGADGFVSKSEFSSKLVPLIDGLFRSTQSPTGNELHS